MVKCNLHSWEGSPQVDYCYMCEKEQYKTNVMNTTETRLAISQSLMQESAPDYIDRHLLAALVEVATHLPKDSITCAVMEDLKHRADRGLQKYNTTLGENNKDDFMNHLYEELLDAAQYIKKEQSFTPTIQKLIFETPNNQELGALIRKIYGKTN